MYSIYTGSIMTDRNANQTDQKYKIYTAWIKQQ